MLFLAPINGFRPNLLFIKLGALFQDCSKAGIGVVIRDSEGLVIGALFEKIPLPPSVEDVEALACRRGIIFAIELGLQEVVVEGDSEVLIKKLKYIWFRRFSPK